MGEIGSQAGYARHAGITRQAVSKGVASGTIPILLDGKIDFDLADRARKANANPARTVDSIPEIPVLPEPPQMAAESVALGAGFAASRAEKERIAVEMAGIALAEKKRELVLRREVEDAMVSAGRMIRQEMDGFADLTDEVVSICAREGGTAEVRQAIKARVTALQQKIADALARLGGEDDG